MPYPLKGSVTVERDLAIGNRLDAGTIGVPAWATGKVYAVGDLGRNAGVLYVASSAHTAGASFVGDTASWGPVSSSSSDAIQALSATGAVTAWSSLVLVTSATAATVTLPAALLANVGHRVTVKNLGVGAVTIAANGADALQGAATLAQFEAATYEVSAAATVVRVDNAAGAGTGTPVASFLRGSRSSGQAVATHNAVVFTAVDASAGTDISLNTTTGHITLKAGKTYRLTGSVVSSITSAQRTQWRWLNLTTGLGIGAAQVFYSPADTAANSASGSPATAIISPSVDTVVLLQNTSLLTSDAGGNPDFGGAGASVHPWFEVEVIGGQESAVVVPATPLHVVSIATSTPDVNAVTTVLTESGVGGYYVPNLTDPMLTKFDPNGMISGNKVVIQQAGRYRLAAGSRAPTATPEPGIRVNGIYVATGDHFGSSELLSYEAVRSLSAGDIVDFAIAATAVASSANGFYLTVEQLPTSTVVDPGAVTVNDQAASGYMDVGSCRFMWGQLANTNDSAQLVTLPAAFASTAYSISLTPDDGWTVGAGEVTPWKWSGKTTTSFNVDRDDDVTGTALVDWIAIGRRP